MNDLHLTRAVSFGHLSPSPSLRIVLRKGTWFQESNSRVIFNVALGGELGCPCHQIHIEA